MKKLKFLVLSLIVASAPVLASVVSQLHPVYSNRAVTLNTVPFSSIHTLGNFDLVVHVGHYRPRLKLTPENHTLNGLQMHIRNRTLYLKMPPMFAVNHRRVKVNVWMRQLKSISNAGRSSLNLIKTNQRNLSISNASNKPIKIEGYVHVSNLNVSGNGGVYVHWVDSSYLTVRGFGSGKIKLAGVVGTLNAKLFNHARLLAKYLRVNHAMVRTTQHAFASVTPIDTLRAFAKNDSNIYFYKHPKHLTRFSSGSGNVLQMAWDN